MQHSNTQQPMQLQQIMTHAAMRPQEATQRSAAHQPMQLHQMITHAAMQPPVQPQEATQRPATQHQQVAIMQALARMPPDQQASLMSGIAAAARGGNAVAKPAALVPPGAPAVQRAAAAHAVPPAQGATPAGQGHAAAACERVPAFEQGGGRGDGRGDVRAGGAQRTRAVTEDDTAWSQGQVRALVSAYVQYVEKRQHDTDSRPLSAVEDGGSKNMHSTLAKQLPSGSKKTVSQVQNMHETLAKQLPSGSKKTVSQVQNMHETLAKQLPSGSKKTAFQVQNKINNAISIWNKIHQFDVEGGGKLTEG
eukprot:364484-Chlamydomonas_euryale.AAC.6